MADDVSRRIRIPPAADDLEAATLRRLRLAATLASGLPDARLVVRPCPGQGRTSFIACAQPADLTPCQLRAAICEGRRRGSFEPIRDLLGLGVSSRPTFELSTPESVRDLGAGLYSIRTGSMLGLVFATLLSPKVAREVAADTVTGGAAARSGGDRPNGAPSMRLRFDSRTEVTVLTGQVDVNDPATRFFVEWARRAAFACVVEELLTDA